MKRLILCLMSFMSWVSIPREAGAATAYLAREADSGSNKICYYTYLGDEHTRNVSVYSACPYSIEVDGRISGQPGPSAPQGPWTAYYTHETTSVATKTCYYQAFGQTYTQSVRLIDLCPSTLSISL